MIYKNKKCRICGFETIDRKQFRDHLRIKHELKSKKSKRLGGGEAFSKYDIIAHPNK